MESVMETTAAPSRRRGAGRWLFWFGILLLALALLALIYELIMAATGGYRTIAAGELWFRLHPYSLNLSQAITQRYLFPSLWDPVIVGLLQWPAWSILGAPGAILAILFRPRMMKEG
ncbi:MAG: hypothetical protein AAGA21_13580 [Pseudomonadota bacterium]